MLTFQYLKSWADRVINTEHAPQSVLLVMVGFYFFAAPVRAEIYYVHNDHRGAPDAMTDAMTDANKNVVGRADWQDHASELSSCASRFSRSSGLNANSTV